MSASPAPESVARSGQDTNETRGPNRLLGAILPPVVALAIAMVVGDLLILTFGESPASVFRLLLEGTWGNAYGFGQVLYKATTLVCTGLAFAIGARAGLFNIGAESQLAAGGFAAAAVGLLLPAGLPGLLAVPVLVLAAIAGGCAVGAVPGALKARFGASEVIVTIMLNFVVLALLGYLVAEHLHTPETLHTETIRSGALPRLADFMSAFHGSAANVTIVLALLNWIVATRLNVAESLHTQEINAGALPRLSAMFETLRGSAANFTLLVTAAACVALWWWLFRARGGFELRAVGLQPEAAEYGGVRVGSVWTKAMALSGALAGLGGINYVLGYKFYYEEGFATGSGFLGIAVALVGRNHPLGVPLAALLFATLSQGGLAVNAIVPKEMVDVLQAVVILAIVMSVPEVRRLLRARVRNGERA